MWQRAPSLTFILETFMAPCRCATDSILRSKSAIKENSCIEYPEHHVEPRSASSKTDCATSPTAFSTAGETLTPAVKSWPSIP